VSNLVGRRLYRNNGDGTFSDVTFPSGIAVNSRYVGWGCGFLDYDNDGRKDLFAANGHVYPEVDGRINETYRQPLQLFRNVGGGKFREVSSQAGLRVLTLRSARGGAYCDYDNDGDIDIAVNCVNAVPQLLRCDSTLNRNWITIKLVGVKSNRTGIGTRVIVTATTKPDGQKPLVQMDELRSGGSYFSQNDLRMHFGLEQATKVDMVEIRWLSGQIDQLKDLDANRLYVVEEGGKILSKDPLKPASELYGEILLGTGDAAAAADVDPGQRAGSRTDFDDVRAGLEKTRNGDALRRTAVHEKVLSEPFFRTQALRCQERPRVRRLGARFGDAILYRRT